MRTRTSLAMLLAILLSASACDLLPWGATGPGSSPRTPTPGSGQPGAVEDRVDGYLATAPRVLRSQQSEAVSVALFKGDREASGTVQLLLLKDGAQVAASSAYISGSGDVALGVPRLPEGDYHLQLLANGVKADSAVRVEDGTLVFAETDKPIYKPGQTVHIRAITLDPQLKPVTGAVTIEVMDAQGLKVFKRDAATDDYGMVSVDLPLSTEPNLGTWKVAVQAGKRTAQVDVRVERYVLPKYEVKIDTAREWVLASDQITGSVSAEYSYGKPVTGEVQIKATRYVGTWQEFANVTKNFDGKTDFQLPAARYVSGVPGSGGMGNVQIEVTVREKATGYEEKTTRLLTVAQSPVVLKAIPESVSFKPGLPLSLLMIAETPDRKPADANVQLSFYWTKKDFSGTQENRQIQVKGGRAMVRVTPPADAISVSIGANGGGATTSLAMQSSYSPTGSFIHLEQVGTSALKVGDTGKFHVTATREAANLYYEVVSHGQVLLSGVSRSPDLEIAATPAMAPGARLLVYQILPNSEVAADYIPFAVQADYPLRVQAQFGQEAARPGDPVEVRLTTDGPAKVGLVAVDRSVFILAVNRLNLQQVFDELESLYQKPQAELHEARPLDKIVARGAQEVFQDAGVVVMSNKQVPRGQEYQSPAGKVFAPGGGAMGIAPARAAMPAAAPQAAAQPTMAAASDAAGSGLMEVQRVRQFFPETWIWDTLTTDQSGKATRTFEAPDSITTWMLRAVALSKQTGLGISDAQLKVMQPFFVTVDLPYSAIRGEQFTVRVALYNYQQTAEEFTVEMEKSDWFALDGQSARTVKVGPNDIGAATFSIRPTTLGTNKVKVVARSSGSSDAIVKELIVEPEGVARESVDNAVLSSGASRQFDLAVPETIIEGSARASISVTGSYLTQTIQGLEKLLQMPFGCGEQNMILLAPNIFVSRYLKETNQLKPEVMAKAEQLMMTGYQRELTYRRGDGSFSAFGNQDKEGSLWLTAFVLKSLAQAKNLIYIDDTVLSSAQAWIAAHQKSDGSFDPVGFIAHQELLGGLKGKSALTAYVAVALTEAGEHDSSARAVSYLERSVDGVNDAYSLALISYALELAKSPRAGDTYARLMGLARESDGGLYWGDPEPPVVLPVPVPQGIAPAPGIAPQVAPLPPRPNRTASIETTAYATLALVEHGDRLNASRAVRWLTSNRNAYGGFGSTQDTVVGLQAMTRYAAGAKSDVDATVVLKSGDWRKEVKVGPDNADVLQLIDVPTGKPLTAEVQGKGQVVLQTVRRFNVPDPQRRAESAFDMKVDYGVGQIEVNDTIDVRAAITFNPPEPVAAGMVVMDVAIPTGFAPVAETLDAAVKAQPKLKRYDVSGRKVIVYIEDMMPGDTVQFSFKARALYPVKAQAVASQAYSYYRPEWKGESLGGGIEVR